MPLHWPLFDAVSHTEKTLVPVAMLIPIGHFWLPCVNVIRFLSIGFAIGEGVPFGVSTSAMNWSLYVVQTNSGYSAEKKYELNENARALVGARSVRHEHHRVVGRGRVGDAAAVRRRRELRSRP